MAKTVSISIVYGYRYRYRYRNNAVLLEIAEVVLDIVVNSSGKNSSEKQ